MVIPLFFSFGALSISSKAITFTFPSSASTCTNVEQSKPPIQLTFKQKLKKHRKRVVDLGDCCSEHRLPVIDVSDCSDINVRQKKVEK